MAAEAIEAIEEAARREADAALEEERARLVRSGEHVRLVAAAAPPARGGRDAGRWTT